MRRSPAEVALSLGVLSLGAAAVAVTAQLPSEGGYAKIGPNFMPALVAGGLIVLGLWLLAEALTGGWRQRSEEPQRFEAAAFAWVSAGLLAHMALVGSGGFVLAGTVLFACTARGFGSRRLARDGAAGFILALAVYLFFVKLLNVSLPAGWMPLPL